MSEFYDGADEETLARIVEQQNEIERLAAELAIANERIKVDDSEYELLTAEGARKDDRIMYLQVALEELARLGNGDKYGNSDGNMIARNALAQLKHTESTDSGSPAPVCSYWAMVDKGRTSYPYEEHWRDCDICQKRDPSRVEHRIATTNSRPGLVHDDKCRYWTDRECDCAMAKFVEKGQVPK